MGKYQSFATKVWFYRDMKFWQTIAEGTNYKQPHHAACFTKPKEKNLKFHQKEKKTCLCVHFYKSIPWYPINMYNFRIFMYHVKLNLKCFTIKEIKTHCLTCVCTASQERVPVLPPASCSIAMGCQHVKQQFDLSEKNTIKLNLAQHFRRQLSPQLYK